MAEEGAQSPASHADIRPAAQLLYPRLGIADPQRIFAASFIAGVIGFSLGAAKEGKLEALRFRAENAHRLPKSEKGWYLYHKSKNYAVMLQSIKEGVKYGGKLGLFIGLFCITEIIADMKMNNKQDFRSTALTGLSSGYLWSRLRESSRSGKSTKLTVADSMSRQATGRMIMLGFQGGLTFGFAQDAVAWFNGRPPAYVKMFTFEKKADDSP